ncbi:MAG: alpha/beta fold hydrolase [Dehalococcoidia bacterium]
MNNTREPWKHRQAIVNGIRLHWVEQGQGPLVVLLHGFPEFWYSWRRQIPVLAERFRVVAPDMRGYNVSEKPSSGYDLDTLTDDLLALIQTLGAERASIVGHDWGGVVAWAFAARFPEATEKLVVLNAPHPGRFIEELRKPRQFLRSTYVLFFQLPAVPELLLGANRAWLVERMLRGSAAVKEAFSDEDLAQYREAASQPGALTGALKYYRALRPWRLPQEQDIRAPTLLLWGDQDQALGKELTLNLERWVPNLTVRYLDCGHWTQQERPDEVNRYLMEFL